MGEIAGEDFDSAPPRAQLLAYRGAEWGGFAFGIVGTWLFFSDWLRHSHTRGLSAAILCLFLRGVGVVGMRGKEDQDVQPSPSVTLAGKDSEDGKKVVSPSSTPTI